MSEILIKQVAHMDGTDGHDLVPFTAEEMAQRDKDIAEDKAKKTADELLAEKTATDKAALLAKLGITADEAKLLLS